MTMKKVFIWIIIIAIIIAIAFLYHNSGYSDNSDNIDSGDISSDVLDDNQENSGDIVDLIESGETDIKNDSGDELAKEENVEDNNSRKT